MGMAATNFKLSVSSKRRNKAGQFSGRISPVTSVTTRCPSKVRGIERSKAGSYRASITFRQRLIVFQQTHVNAHDTRDGQQLIVMIGEHGVDVACREWRSGQLFAIHTASHQKHHRR